MKHCEDFNSTLVGKLLWRMLDDHKPIGFDLLRFRHSDIKSKIFNHVSTFSSKRSLYSRRICFLFVTYERRNIIGLRIQLAAE